MLNDIRQGGKEYVEEFFSGLEKIVLKDELVFELFNYADEAFFKRLHKAILKYSIELTLESGDENLSRLNGKLSCTNEKILETLKAALNNGCSKIDLFFMIGIPGQDYQSALKNVEFCECIHKKCGEDQRISYFIAPLSPFLDPGSPAFENPNQYGYRKFCHTLEDFRQAVLQPSWKNMLSYETTSMTRKEIVNATYQSAKKLNQFKFDHQIIDKEVYEEVDHKIIKSIEFLERIDELPSLPPEEQKKELASIKEEVEFINRHSICGKNELKWEVKKLFANLPSLTYIGLELLMKEIVKTLKCKIGKIDRHVVSVSSSKVRIQQK